MPRKLEFGELPLRERIPKCGWKVTLFAGVLALVALTYWSSLRSPLVGDDFYFINPPLDQNFSSYPHYFLFATAPYYLRPLVLIAWTIQFHLFGSAALPSHMINVLFHAGSAYLLYILLSRLKISRAGALLAAALFTVTPTAVEVISWSSGRFDAMAMFFMLLAMYLYLTCMSNESRLAMVGFILSAVAALMSKETAYILLILVPAMQLLFSGKAESGNIKKSLRGQFHPMYWHGVAALYIVYGAITLMRIWIFGGMGGQYPIFGPPHAQAAYNTIKTLFAPLNITEFTQGAISRLLIYVAIVTGLSFAVTAWRWKEAPASLRRAWMFFFLFFIVSFVPVFRRTISIGILEDLEDIRYLYVAALGLICLIVIGFFEFSRKERGLQTVAALALLIIIPFYIYGVRQDSRLWDEQAAAVEHLVSETKVLLPDPKPGAKIYLKGVPTQVWKYYYTNGLDMAIRVNYARKDIDVTPLEIDESPDDPGNGYLFVYMASSKDLRLISRPKKAAS